MVASKFKNDNCIAEVEFYDEDEDIFVIQRTFPPMFNGDKEWESIDISFGEVRHLPGRARTPMGAEGMVHASGSWSKGRNGGPGGSALPGYEIEGFKWRVGGVAPKSRTNVRSIPDHYVQVDDIMSYLLKYREQVASAPASHSDPTILGIVGSWDTAEEGW